MDKLYDRIILLICCSIFLLLNNISTNAFIAIGAAILFASVAYYFQQPSGDILVYMGYVIFCIIFPECTFMLPLMNYDIICEPYRALCIFGFFNLVRLIFIYDPLTIVYILILTLLAYFLRKRTIALEKSKQEYLDTMGSLSHLKAQSRDFLERQDYEVKNATLNERNRIAREIHDTVGHLPSSALLQIGAILVICKDDNIKEALTTTKETLSQGMDNIRASIHNIHEESLDLKFKVTELLNNFKFCETKLSYDIEHDFSIRAKYSLISIVKEALNNIMKHSEGASLVTLNFKELEGHYEITIHDNGKQTIMTSGRSSADSGMGISSIRERIECLDGHFHVDRTNGYMLFITLPVNNAEEKQ